MHDIIDNRHEKLIEHIEIILDLTKCAKFAVGYFFVSDRMATKVGAGFSLRCIAPVKGAATTILSWLLQCS